MEYLKFLYSLITYETPLKMEHLKQLQQIKPQ